MYSGLSEIYKYQITYCSFKVMYGDCKWYEFIKKKTIKEQLNFYYPLMLAEVKGISNFINPSPPIKGEITK